MRSLILSLFIVITLLANASPGFSTNSGFVKAKGTKFILNEKPFHFVGANIYYLMVYAADPLLRKAVDEVMEEAATLGLKGIRTFAFNDGKDQWNALQISPGVYQEQVFQGLDYVLAKADKVGIRLILPLINNWKSYGGIDQYVAWSSTANSHDDFYTDSNTRKWFKNYIYTVLNRVNTINGKTYKNDPTIFAWELGNELRAQSNPSGNTLQNWIIEMSSYIKKIDPHHLVSIGIEGFYNDQGIDFIRNHQLSTIDFCTVHLWPDSLGMNYEQSIKWARKHIDQAHKIIGKPIILEEFGKNRDKDGSTTIRDRFYQGLFSLIYTKKAAGAIFWALYHDEYKDWDKFGVYYPKDTSTARIIATEAARINSLALSKGRRGKVLISLAGLIAILLPALIF